MTTSILLIFANSVDILYDACVGRLTFESVLRILFGTINILSTLEATMAQYFGFAIADSMFPRNATVIRQKLLPEAAKALLQAGAVIPCLNPSHTATIHAMAHRHGIVVEIPASAPKVELNSGDSLIVLSVRGLPRLEDNRHEYTEAEVASATFEFSIWHVLPEAEFQGFCVSGFMHGGGADHRGKKAALPPSQTEIPESPYGDSVRGIEITFK